MPDDHAHTTDPGERRTIVAGSERGVEDVPPIESQLREEDLEPARDGLLEPEDDDYEPEE